MVWRRNLQVVCRLIALFSCVWMVAQQAVAPAAEPDAPEAAVLVGQLGDDAYEVREQASHGLAELGLKAHDALGAGLKNRDPEVRRRCRWLLRDVLEDDFRNRLEAFAADPEGKHQHNLPGWERYREVVGAGPDARKLFVKLQRAESGLMISIAAGGPSAADGLKLRFQQVYTRLSHPDPRQRKTPSMETTAALLLVAADPTYQTLQTSPNASYLTNLVQQADFRKAISDGPHKPSVRKLLGRWILCPTEQNVLHQKLQLAMQFQIEEGLGLAVRAVNNDKVSPHYRVQAVAAIGRLGGKPHVATLAALLDDKSECGRRVINGKQFATELRDVALVWLVHLTDQDLESYGFKTAAKEFERLKNNPRHYVNVYSFSFNDPSKRDEAFKKWKAYVEKNPLPDAPRIKLEADKAAGNPAPQPAAPVLIGPQPGVIVVGPGAVAQVAEAAEGELSEAQPVTADRRQLRSLNLARRLCQRRDYANAVQILDNILKSESDWSFRPAPKTPLLCFLKPAAERLLAELPSEGRRAYRDRFEPQARPLLDDAAATGSAEALARVVERFFYTRSGADATYLLATYRLHHDHPFHAALHLERLRKRPVESDRLEPSLSALLAACWWRAGMPEAAENVLLQMQARYPDAMVSIAGERRKMFARPEEARDWLASIIGPPRRPRSRGGWPMFRGDPARNLSGGGGPLLEGRPLTPVCENPWVVRTVGLLRKEQSHDYRAEIPQLHPLVVGNTVVFRTATHLRAVELASGRMLWQSSLEDSLRYMLPASGEDPQDVQAEGISRGLKRRFWRDATFGQLSSDGHYVFGVEDLAFGYPSDAHPIVVTSDGQRRLDPGPLRRHNRLTAYDLRTGKLQWELGGPPDVADAELSGMFFLGPPLPLGRRLYVVARVGQDTRLLELDSQSGRKVDELVLNGDDQEPVKAVSNSLVRWQSEEPWRRHGASPSYADGVLICPTPENHLVAVDLATRAISWIYQVPTPQASMSRNAQIRLQRQLMQSAAPERHDRWSDASVTIAEGCLVWTPPDSDELICLNLADGNRQWSAPRRDGLYVGGVCQGKVIIVGRGSVRALQLADGTPAWPQPVPLPPDAVPTGRGLLEAGRYHVPLGTAEVASIDLRRGRLAARSRSPEGIVPGNLVACLDSVLSLGNNGLWRFDLVSHREKQLAAAVSARPNDPKVLTEFGRVLLCRGKVSEAVAHLERAMEIERSPQTQQVLTEALLDGLQIDFDAFRRKAEQLAARKEIGQQRDALLQQLALAEQRAGDVEAAMETYLELVDSMPEGDDLQRFEAVRGVRPDRWIQARLAELRTEASPDQRAEIDRRTATWLSDGRLRDVLTYFATSPMANRARLQLAEELVPKREFLEASMLLRYVLGSEDAAEHREAVARLAELLHRTEASEDAARFYGHLGGQLAKTVCLDGKTGRELVEALPAESPSRRPPAASNAWPLGKVQVEVNDESRNVNATGYPIAIVGQGGAFDTAACVWMDASQKKLRWHDSLGRAKAEVTLENVATTPHVLNFGGLVYPVVRGWLDGQFLVVRFHDRVCAIDGLGKQAKVLWNKEVVDAKARNPGMRIIMGMRGRRPGQPLELPGSERLSLAVTSHCVCFQHHHSLMAVDPLTGQTLWTRDDLPSGCDLFGDDEILFVTPPDAKEAVVLDALDGREIGRRPVPPLKDRAWPLGRRVITWSAGEKEARLALTDLWTGQVAWQHTFDPKAKSWLVDAAEIAVLEPQGCLSLFALPEGNLTLRSRIDPIPDLDGIILLRSTDRYVLFANEPRVQRNVRHHGIYAGQVPVHGQVYGFDRRTGKIVWRREVRQQSITLHDAGELPALVFLNSVQKTKENKTTSRTAMLCLDKRNGRVLHSQESDGTVPNLYRVNADPENHRLEIRSYVGTIQLTFTDEPVPDEPVPDEQAPDES